MASDFQAGQGDTFVQRRFTDGTMWICQEALLPCFDSETRGTWRLVCKRARERVEATTQRLTWHGDESSPNQADDDGENSEPGMALLFKCPALQKVHVLNAPMGLTLPSLPHSLRTLEVDHGPDPYPDCTPGWRAPVRGPAHVKMSAPLSPLTALTRLEKAVLHAILDI
eukprot:gene3617-biopygen21356